MEQRQQAGRWVAVRQAEELAAKVDRIVADDPGFVPDPAVKIPRYVSAVDHHCMPGSYHTELFPGDVSAAANYDSGIFVDHRRHARALLPTAAAMQCCAGSGAIYRDSSPRDILDIGSTLGHSLLPIAAAYPERRVTAIDVSKPVLRYALAARARSG